MLLNSPVLPNFVRGFAIIALATFSLGAFANHHEEAMKKAETTVEDAMDVSEAKEGAMKHKKNHKMDHKKKLTAEQLDEGAAEEMKSEMSDKETMDDEAPEE